MFLRFDIGRPSSRSGELVRRPSRAGFSLLELVVAISIMVIVMGSLGAMAKAVNEGALYGETYGAATQHARIAMERIGASVRGATTSNAFPGFLVIEESVGGWTFPDILVVWHPDGVPADPDRLPQVNELRIYTPNPTAPNELLEVRFPDNMTKFETDDQLTAWVSDAKASADGVRTVLTDMLRTAQVSSLASSARGAVRFAVRYRPTEEEMADFKAGVTGWDDLAWPQGIYTSNAGMRQAWVQMELQLVPRSTSVSVASSDKTAIPFLGSAARFYEVHP